MPRLPTLLLRAAREIDPLLPLLLRPCRDLRAAQNELRWLREHIQNHAAGRNITERTALLRRLVQERSSGKPLQYILGTEYFGDLEIECRPGVLIPRQETAASVTHLVRLLRESKSLPSELRVLDLCTGTGCIPLLVQDEFASKRQDTCVELLGVDVSVKAIGLARRNLGRLHRQGNIAIKNSISFIQADILKEACKDSGDAIEGLLPALSRRHKPTDWDILISNPPYISPSEYWKTTTRSVRGFEPTLALVPPPKAGLDDIETGDSFYPRLLQIARDVEAKIVLFEVANLDQGFRVASMARQSGIFAGVEVWRDDPDQPAELDSASLSGPFPVVGTGNGRSVLCWSDQGATWLGKGV